MRTLEPGTRCECIDTTHAYDETRPYAHHVAGRCPCKAVRIVAFCMVPVRHAGVLTSEGERFDLAMCDACATFFEKGGAR